LKRALVAGVFVLCLGPAADAQAARLVLFPTPLTQLTATPPFQPPYTALPNLFRPPIRSTEAISVGVDERGDVVSVATTQRLVLTRTGDYRLTVPAPATDVFAGPGSESSPGLRKGAILWAGFAAGRKLLSARATLDPRAAAAALPLEVRISNGSVRLENATATTTSTFTADGDQIELAKILDSLRADPQGRSLGRGTYVKVTGSARPERVRVSAALRITGRIGGRRIELVLGGGRPLGGTIEVQGRPSIELEVEPVPPDSLLRPPRGRSWVEAVRLGAVPRGRAFFDDALKASLTLARVRQYDAFLVNPDSLGRIGARYLYRTVAAPAPVPAPSPAQPDEGLAAWVLALIVAGSLAAAGGLAVLWANS
jgi:hypothetical protein